MRKIINFELERGNDEIEKFQFQEFERRATSHKRPKNCDFSLFPGATTIQLKIVEGIKRFEEG